MVKTRVGFCFLRGCGSKFRAPERLSRSGGDGQYSPLNLLPAWVRLKILTLRAPAEAMPVAGGSMAGSLGGSLARWFGRLVATLNGGFAAGLISHRAQRIVGISDVFLTRTSLDYQTQCTRNHGSHRQSRTLTMMVLEMLAD